MDKLLINSIYMACEGEGVFIGSSQIFIRFQGCSIGCANCDSMDTWEFDSKYGIEFSEVLSRVEKIHNEFPVKRISITGGDPLHPAHLPGVLKIVSHYKKKGFFVNIEASGMRVVPELFDAVDFVSFDY